ncbi:MAG: chitobiase/beta-hexosaminidase C-terminal domain-containing protein [Fibrobacterota bacterium]|nr:chitobiase/beta-hexosaminidase C-terminal domain-containing protein [Fibrobacterota bacterium]
MSFRKCLARNHWSLSLLLAMWFAIPSTAQLPKPPPPEFLPNGNPAWVGASTTFAFAAFRSGKVFYTLDGSDPSHKGSNPGSQIYEYSEGSLVTLTYTTTVKAIHYVSGTSSVIVPATFTRAKVPALLAKSGGKTNFHPTVNCTLTFAKSIQGLSPAIKYTLDGSAPNATSLTYGPGALEFDKSLTLRAYAIEPGYDDSDPIQVAFTLLQPPAPPVATPAGLKFSTNTLNIRLKSVTPESYVVYTVDTTQRPIDTTLKTLEGAKIVPGDSISIVGTTPNNIITVRAQAMKGGYPSSAILTEKYIYSPAVATPVLSRSPGAFYDSTTLFLTSATSGATIRYVLDTTSPLSAASPGDGTKPIVLTSSTYIRAQAFKSGQPNSAVLPASFTLKLTPPLFDKPSGQFTTDTIPIKLTSKSPGALIFYTLDGTTPTVLNSHSVQSGSTVGLSADSTVLKAIAVKDGIVSLVDSGTYVRRFQIERLSAPTIQPAGREFEDSIYVSIHTDAPLAEIRYTTDSTEPTHNSAKYNSVILVDTTTLIRAKAFPTIENLEPSEERSAKFTLIPSRPIASKTASTPYSNKVEFTLDTKTSGGVIKYILGNSPLALELASTYTKGKVLVLTSTTRLQALTVLGSGLTQRLSAPLDVTYEIYTGPSSDTLTPGASQSLSGGVTFTNTSTTAISATTHTTDGLGLVGFKEAPLAMTLKLIQPGDAVKVTFTKPAGQLVSLYRAVNGRVEFISSDNPTDLLSEGVYFVGVDTLEPVITMLTQTPKPGDSTVIRLSIKDNVMNPSCVIESPGLPGKTLTRKPDANGEVTVGLKVIMTDFQGLWFKASSSDFYNTGRLPRDPDEKLYLSQIWARLNTPSVLSLGNRGEPWDMAGFPVSAASPVSWSQFRNDNDGANLRAMVWSDPLQDYMHIEDSDSIKPGMAFWLSSPSTLTSVALTQFRAAESETDGSYRMTLHPGWNQVTSPSLEKVYWPTTLKTTKNPQVLVKAPYQYLPAIKDYVQVDVLDPWKGYFVYFFGTRDTVITLFTNAAKRPAAKSSAESDGLLSLRIVLDYGRPMPLSLGAHPQAQEGIGSEDEPDLPAWQRNLSVWSQRGKRRLISDVVRFAPGVVLHWKVVLADSTQAQSRTEGPFRIKFLEGKMPAGYQAWAVSSARRMKFRLEAGQELPMSGLPRDTLSIYAGPLDKLSGISELVRAPSSIEHFSFDLEKGLAGNVLRLALPWIAKVEVSVWSASGTRLLEAKPGRLAPGNYRLPLRNSGNSAIGLLRIRLLNENGPTEYARPILW